MLVAKVGTKLFEEQDKPIHFFSCCARVNGVLTKYNLI